MDLGLLKVLHERKVLAFEGDRERWLIPAEAILSCETASYSEIAGDAVRQYLVVLQVQTPTGPRELPLSPRGEITSTTAGRVRATEKLVTAISVLQKSSG
jgi:hypothetical protein